jgi:SAM-dependent methyltransferase
MSDASTPVGGQYEDADLYGKSFDIRQRLDLQWALEFLADRIFTRVLDIGCGNGEFLAQLVQREMVKVGLAGLDRSEAMVSTTRERLRPILGGLPLELWRCDAQQPSPMRGRFALISILAVLHWLYPQESEVLRWARERLEDGGLLIATTYHPPIDGELRGGSDEVALEAMRRIGGPREFPRSFTPMELRTRTESEVGALFGSQFVIQSVHTRDAVTQASDPIKYIRYHQATFGDYYSRLLAEGTRGAFFETLGDVAMERMRRHGLVTSVKICLWICGRR